MNESTLNLDDQLIVDEQLNEIHRDIDELINRVYLMGYNKGLHHKDNTPKLP